VRLSFSQDEIENAGRLSAAAAIQSSNVQSIREHRCAVLPDELLDIRRSLQQHISAEFRHRPAVFGLERDLLESTVRISKLSILGNEEPAAASSQMAVLSCHGKKRARSDEAGPQGETTDTGDATEKPYQGSASLSVSLFTT
jgi:hypothetical protein